MEVVRTLGQEQRAFTRIHFVHPLQWIHSNGEDGKGELRNVSRTGLSFSLRRYLRPGPFVQLVFPEICYRGEPVALPAIIVWCGPSVNGPDRFNAGLKVIHGEPHILAAVSEVFYSGLDAAQAGSSYPCA